MNYPVVFADKGIVLTWDPFSFEFAPFEGMKVRFSSQIFDIDKKYDDQVYKVESVEYCTTHSCFICEIQIVY